MESNSRLETKAVSNLQRLCDDPRSAIQDDWRRTPERGNDAHRFFVLPCTHRSHRRVQAAAGALGSPRLSANDERALAERIKMGDTTAQKQLIMANLALVRGAVREYRRSGIPLDDLIQEGNLGLIRAAQHFDPSTHDARFATYARFWIQASLVRALASNGSLIQLPERLQLLLLRYRRAISRHCNELPSASEIAFSKPPSHDEIARHVGVGPRRFKWVGLTRTDRTLCLRLNGLMLADGSSPDRDMVNEEVRTLVYSALRRLSPFEAWVIRERFGLGEPCQGRDHRNNSHQGKTDTLRAIRSRAASLSGGAPIQPPRPSQSYHQRSYIEIGFDCGLSVHRIRRVEKAALEKLRMLLAP